MACRSFEVIACQKDLKAEAKLAMVRTSQTLAKMFSYGFAILAGGGESVATATLSVVESS